MVLKFNLCFVLATFFIITYFDGTLAHNDEKRQVVIDSRGECDPVFIPNGFYILSSYLNENTETLPPGSPIPNNVYLVFFCNLFYELSPPTSAVACIDGVWNQTIPSCIPTGGLNEAEEEITNENDSCGDWDEGFQAPWHVGIYERKNKNTYQYVCGGSLVSSNVIVTAAHCFTADNNRTINPTDMYIGAGKWRSDYEAPLDWTAQHSQVKKYIIPTNYKGVQSNLEGDLGLIIVKEPFISGFYVHPVCIDWENRFENQQLTPGNTGYVQGWGFTDVAQKTPSQTLQQLGVPFVEREACLDTVPTDFHKYVTDDKFCAGYTNGSCVCNGDDGGGLVFRKTGERQNKYYIRGLVSTFPQKNGACDMYQYGVYTKISSYKDFIQNAVNENKVKNRILSNF